MMEENIKEVIEEIKNVDEDTLRSTIEKWLESTRNQGIKMGAQYMSAAIFSVIQSHTTKAGKVSLNDYKRMTADIKRIVSVQLQNTEQNDSEDSSADNLQEDDKV